MKNSKNSGKEKRKEEERKRKEEERLCRSFKERLCRSFKEGRRTLPQFDVSVRKTDTCKMGFENYLKF